MKCGFFVFLGGLLNISNIKRGFFYEGFALGAGSTRLIGKLDGICVIKESYTLSTPCVMLVDGYYGRCTYIAGRELTNITLIEISFGDMVSSRREMSIKNKSSVELWISIAYQTL